MTEPSARAASSYDSAYSAQAATLSGFWRRFLAYLIDAIILAVVGSIIQAVLSPIVQAPGSDTTGLGVRSGVISFILGLIYFGFLWSRNGQTVGYMAMGIRLVRADGAPVSAVLAGVRFALIELSFLFCLVPAIVSAFMIGLGRQKQAIHDSIVGTLVVRA